MAAAVLTISREHVLTSIDYSAGHRMGILFSSACSLTHCPFIMAPLNPTSLMADLDTSTVFHVTPGHTHVGGATLTFRLRNVACVLIY